MIQNYKVNKLKILNDPIYGFVTLTRHLVFDVISHKYFQRLRRISQMGLANLIYPGAHHTRFHHAIGCVHLMNRAIQVLRTKQVEISEKEEEGALLAILLHDIGHGPYSHSLENSIICETSHEQVSLHFMKLLNDEFEGKLSLAIEIFKGTYKRQFLNQLISGQLDMDRMDYLKRDSFYTGVVEGNISSERIISMLNVKDDELVLEEKGIYSAENFILARRFMYWQVYFHKTSLVVENLLVLLFKRVKWLVSKGNKIFLEGTLAYFIENKITNDSFDKQSLDLFAEIDDTDVMFSIKRWQFSSDKVVSDLSKMIIERKLPKIKIKRQPFKKLEIDKIKKYVLDKYKLQEEDLGFYVFDGVVKNQAYDTNYNGIRIINREGKLKDITHASDNLNLQSLSRPVLKYFICFPK